MKNNVKNYLKILAVTLGIQLAGFALTYFADNLLGKVGPSTILPVFIGGLSIILSMIVSVILSVKLFESNRARIIIISLLPTNYTWLLLMIAVVKFVKRILDILGNIPENFG